MIDEYEVEAERRLLERKQRSQEESIHDFPLSKFMPEIEKGYSIERLFTLP